MNPYGSEYPLSERLIRTPSVEEACSYLEGWARGARFPAPLLLVGKEGVGKGFLLRWAIALAEQFRQNGKGRPLLPPPQAVHIEAGHIEAGLDPTLHIGDHKDRPYTGSGLERSGFFVIAVGEPEYERKQGVLLEWARLRGVEFSPRALELILRFNTHNLERLRGLLARVVLESAGKRNLSETDVLRTLERSGLLNEVFPSIPSRADPHL